MTGSPNDDAVPESDGPGGLDGFGVVFQSEWHADLHERTRSVRVVPRGVMVRRWLYSVEPDLSVGGVIAYGVAWATALVSRMVAGDRYKVAVLQVRGGRRREKVINKIPIRGKEEALSLATSHERDIWSFGE